MFFSISQFYIEGVISSTDVPSYSRDARTHLNIGEEKRETKIREETKEFRAARFEREWI